MILKTLLTNYFGCVYFETEKGENKTGRSKECERSKKGNRKQRDRERICVEEKKSNKVKKKEGWESERS